MPSSDSHHLVVGVDQHSLPVNSCPTNGFSTVSDRRQDRFSSTHPVVFLFICSKSRSIPFSHFFSVKFGVTMGVRPSKLDCFCFFPLGAVYTCHEASSAIEWRGD